MMSQGCGRRHGDGGAGEGDEDIPNAGNYEAEVCGNLRLRRDEDVVRGQ